MRQIWIPKYGPPEVLQVRESPDPEAGAGQVRVRVRAAGINFADLMARLGLYEDAPPLPCVVGYEVSGVVDQVGAAVSSLKVGDRVFAMPKFGGYSDTVVLPAEQVLRMPEAMSFEEAAALPVVYLTAHHMIFYTGFLHVGSRVLVHSAAGGVGLAAIQLLRARNCEIFGTASASKHAFLREQGVQHPLVPEGYAEAVRALLPKDRGLDLVLDAVGGRSFREGYELLGPAGRLVMFGMSSAASGKQRNLAKAVWHLAQLPRFSPIKLMNDNKSVCGVNMGHLFDRLDMLRPQFLALIELYEKGLIKPHVDRTFRFDEAAAAHHYLHDRKARGKVLLVP
ncbi:MAG: medium chain dehydrogenase/reductase family protein [Polyangia bacterium]